MAIDVTVQRLGDYLVPVAASDRETVQAMRQGQGFRVSLVKVSDRSIQHHKLYWGGLVRLVSDYWEPESGLISRYDRKVMKGLIDWVANQGKDPSTLKMLINLYLEDRAKDIKQHLLSEVSAANRLQAVHDWLKEESGYYDAVLTPTGVKKQLKSINFNSMKSQEEFDEFYKKVFGVAWRYVLSKAHFNNQEEAENIAIQMSQMG